MRLFPSRLPASRTLPGGVLRMGACLGVLAAALAPAAPAAANMAISQVIIDFATPSRRRIDIQITNRGRERIYVVAEPSQILHPGTPREQRVRIVDPGKHGLLVTPLRMILEPGQRRILRFAALSAPADADRVYRVTVRPVVGKLNTKKPAIKVVVGYDLLVIQRPARARAAISAVRRGGYLVVTNRGNTNALLMNGRQCAPGGRPCRRLSARRVYAGATVRIRLRGGGPVHFLVQVGDQTTRRQF